MPGAGVGRGGPRHAGAGLGPGRRFHLGATNSAAANPQPRTAWAWRTTSDAVAVVVNGGVTAFSAPPFSR